MDVTRLKEEAGDAFGVVDIHLTAIGLDREGSRLFEGFGCVWHGLNRSGG